MKKYIFSFLIISFIGFASLSQAAVRITLEQAQADAIENSAALKQAKMQAESALAAYKSTQSGLYPSLSFDAKGTYVSQVPSINMGFKSFEFGSKWGSSVGPSLSYNLFDYGQTEKQAKSAYSSYNALLNQAEFTRRNVILQVRAAYFTVQQDLQHIYFAYEQQKVADKQMKDVSSAYKAGAKSNLDMNMAQKQQLKAMLNISSLRAALGGHLRELFRLTGNDYGADVSYPQDARLPASSDATAYIETDDFQTSLAALKSSAALDFDDNSPRLAALTDTAQYYEYLAQSFSAALYPRVTLSGGVYWEYPNGPLHEDVVDGRAGVALRIPIFEGGKNKQAALSKRKEKEAELLGKQDIGAEMQKLFYSSKSMLKALTVQEELTKQVSQTCSKTAQLTYEAYKAGTVTFLEVDNANLNLLEAETALADIYAKRLNSLAVMDNLGRIK